MSLDPVSPINPVAPYLGGKRNLARRLTSLIDGIDHQLYAEPFVGMGGIFFRRRRQPRAEVINDRSRDVANLFRILQRHYPQFIECLRFQLTTRTEFERLTRTDPGTLTDLERAARFLYLQKTAFGGKPSGRSFGVSPDRPARFDLSRVEADLEEAHSRLSAVVIECLDWAAFIDRYDRPEALFYIDPPYWGGEGDYGPTMFDRGQFVHLAERLARLRGRFVMSINDVPEIRELFGRFTIEEVELRYGISRQAAAKSAPRRELIVTGTRPDPLA